MGLDFDISKLVVLRKLTTALAENFNRQAREYLANLTPMLQPAGLLGDLIRFEKSSVKTQEAAFRDLVKVYQPVARSTALNLQTELKTPLDIYGATLDIVPASYSYTPEGNGKPITVISPLKWVVIYKDLGPQRLRELVASHARSGGNDLQSCVLHYLTLHVLAERRPGVAPILDALRFPLTSTPNSEFAGLPFVYLSSPLSTIRPPDSVIVQSTLISGSTVFEEVVDVSSLRRLRDPLKERVLELVKEHGGNMTDDLISQVNTPP